MLLKTLDLLRTFDWRLMHFIFNLINSLFGILKGLNAFDIINSVLDNNNFVTFQKGIIAISVTLLGLFAITRFVKKIIDSDEIQSSKTIIKEIVKCGLLAYLELFKQIHLQRLKNFFCLEQKAAIPAKTVNLKKKLESNEVNPILVTLKKD